MKSLLIVSACLISLSTMASPSKKRACGEQFSKSSKVERCVRIAKRKKLNSRQIRSCRSISCLREKEGRASSYTRTVGGTTIIVIR